MFGERWIQLQLSWGTWRNRVITPRSIWIGKKVSQSWKLLANYGPICKWICENMWSKLVTQGHPQRPSARIACVDVTMAFLAEGNGYTRPFPPSSRTTQILDCVSGLFHLVDRVIRIGKDHNNKYIEIVQEEHPSAIRNPLGRHNRQ